MKIQKIHLVGFLLAFGLRMAVAEETSLDPHLSILQPLVGKVLKGKFANSSPERPVVDVQHWERALNGQAVRMTHSINNGFYGGETMFVWDEKKQAITYYYFTTDTFMTTGTIKKEEGHLITHETVSGDANGISEVRSTCEFQADGKFHVKAEYFKDGKWTFGHEATYEEDPDAKVVFK
jgi:hypothetical protein